MTDHITNRRLIVFFISVECMVKYCFQICLFVTCVVYHFSLWIFDMNQIVSYKFDLIKEFWHFSLKIPSDNIYKFNLSCRQIQKEVQCDNLELLTPGQITKVLNIFYFLHSQKKTSNLNTLYQIVQCWWV